MSTIATPRSASVALPDIPLRVSSALRAFAAGILARWSKSGAEPWHTLSGRLLRDIGVTPTDAAIARLYGRRGVPDVSAFDPITVRRPGV